ncbi:MAG: thioredoxin family protein [Prevotella sp.]|nr:thioredoxin family protein [Prevotella sp.]
MRKRLPILFTLFAFLGIASVQAQPLQLKQGPVKFQKSSRTALAPRNAIELGENQIWFGYYDPQGLLYEVGSAKPGVGVWGIYLPYEKAPKGHIDGVRFLWQGETYKDLKVLLATSLVYNADDADIAVINLKNEDVDAQEGITKEFAFDQSYDIPEQGVYVIVSYNITRDIPSPDYDDADAYNEWVAEYWTDAYPLFTYWQTDAVPNSLFCYMQDNNEWFDYPGYGQPLSLALDLLIGGIEYPHNAADASNFAQTYVLANSETSLPVTITNKGDHPVSSLGFKVEVEGEEAQTGTVTLDTPIEKMDQTMTVYFPVRTGDKTGRKTVALTITEVNGEANEVEPTAATGYIFAMAQSEQMKPFVEEFTGTWCGWCVRGMVAMEQLAQDFGSDAVLTAVHYNDPMALKDYYNVTRYFSDGFPSMALNRMGTVDPYYGMYDMTTVNAYKVKEVVEIVKGMLTPGSIQVEATWTDEAQTKIAVNTTTTFQFDADESPFAIGYLLLADRLTGEGSNWMQKNSYSGNAAAAQGDENLLPYVDQASPFTAVYNHVPVAVYGVSNGVSGSIEGSVQIGKPISSTFEMDITDNTLVQDKEKLSVAAILIDKRSWEVINSDKAVISITTGISSVATSAATVPTACYSLSGQRMGMNHKGLSILRQADGSTMKVINR